MLGVSGVGYSNNLYIMFTCFNLQVILIVPLFPSKLLMSYNNLYIVLHLLCTYEFFFKVYVYWL